MSRVTLCVHTTQAVTCELGECVRSMSRELGFTTLEQTALYVFLSLHLSTPLVFHLSVSFPPFPVFLFVTWLSGMQGTRPPSFSSPRQLWCTYAPQTRSLPIPPLVPSQAVFLWCYKQTSVNCHHWKENLTASLKKKKNLHIQSGTMRQFLV